MELLIAGQPVRARRASALYAEIAGPTQPGRGAGVARHDDLPGSLFLVEREAFPLSEETARQSRQLENQSRTAHLALSFRAEKLNRPVEQYDDDFAGAAAQVGVLFHLDFGTRVAR